MSEDVTRRCDNRRVINRKRRKCNNPITEDRPSFFSVETTAYAVDLCDDCKILLMEALAPFIQIARPEYTKINAAVRKAIRAQNGQPFTQADVRQWMLDNDMPVSHTGRIKQEYIDAYEKAMGLTN